MTQIDFHLQLNHNDNWSMSRLHFHDYCEFLLPLTSPGNIFVNDQVYPLRRGTLYLIGENTLHRTIATGFHARYVLHISRKALSALSTPQTDFSRMAQSAFLRADMTNDQMISLIERFQALERNKNDGAFGSDIHQMVALLNLLIRVAPTLNAATAGEAIRNKDFLRVSPIWTISGTTCPSLSPWIRSPDTSTSASTTCAGSSNPPPAPRSTNTSPPAASVSPKPY